MKRRHPVALHWLAEGPWQPSNMVSWLCACAPIDVHRAHLSSPDALYDDRCKLVGSCCEEQDNFKFFSMKNREVTPSVAAALQGKGTKRKLKLDDGSAPVHKWRKERLK